MKGLVTLLAFFHIASGAKHTLDFDHVLISGIPNVPKYIVMEEVEEDLIFYYDTTMSEAAVKPVWIGDLIRNHTKEWDTLVRNCIDYHQVLKSETESFHQLSNQHDNGYIIQQVVGCNQDNETGKVDAYIRYSYNQDDFISFDINNGTWTAFTPQAQSIKQKWDQNKDRNTFWKSFLLKVCPEWINRTLIYGSNYLTRKVLPSVSLLQKTPSSPVTCHATGFTPNKAVMFWSKGGEEIHQIGTQVEILTNNDGTFQMSVDLNVSEIPPEDWKKYDCVFRLSGVEHIILVKLDRDIIRTNRENDDTLSEVGIAVIATMACLIVIIIAVLGLTAVKKRPRGMPVRETSPTPSTSETSSL